MSSGYVCVAFFGLAGLRGIFRLLVDFLSCVCSFSFCPFVLFFLLLATRARVEVARVEEESAPAKIFRSWPAQHGNQVKVVQP